MQHAIANELNGSLRWIRGGENQILRKRNETELLLGSAPYSGELDGERKRFSLCAEAWLV